jgi:DNA invertase Pin-like site-specific DNA recombinase
MSKRAIAYVSDIILGNTGTIVSRDYQKEQINKYAKDNDIEVVAWFEDRMYNENILERPGVTELMSCSEKVDCVLVERVWAFSRDFTKLTPVFEKLENKGMKLEAATTMWDCCSQRVRRYFTATNPNERRAPRAVMTREQAGPVMMSKPKRINFLQLVRTHSPA